MRSFVCIVLLATVALADVKVRKFGKRGIFSEGNGIDESYNGASSYGGGEIDYVPYSQSSAAPSQAAGSEVSADSGNASSGEEYTEAIVEQTVGNAGGYEADDASYTASAAYASGAESARANGQNGGDLKQVAYVPYPINVRVQVPANRPGQFSEEQPAPVPVERQAPLPAEREVSYFVRVPVRIPVPNSNQAQVENSNQGSFERTVPAPAVAQPESSRLGNQGPAVHIHHHDTLHLGSFPVPADKRYPNTVQRTNPAPVAQPKSPRLGNEGPAVHIHHHDTLHLGSHPVPVQKRFPGNVERTFPVPFAQPAFIERPAAQTYPALHPAPVFW